ncbi:MAG: hypothetical protein C0183_10605 [Roseiflexus castenholzii]|uniref:hypothetical protein n=1 Tax=Roseiflexus castenholzii TaxID=120962 RepID=UPI000CA7DD96|nr:MAG: hypothetical protein C0183_10605 [Roseiflexus castenholzii]
MVRKDWFRLLLALGLMLALLAPARITLAVEADGMRTLQAQGKGIVKLVGDGSVSIGRGADAVWVKNATRIMTEGKGRRTVLPDGTVRLTGYTGAVTLIGEGMEVKVVGGVITIRAEGHGTATLYGAGTYETVAAQGEWVRTGAQVEY